MLISFTVESLIIVIETVRFIEFIRPELGSKEIANELVGSDSFFTVTLRNFVLLAHTMASSSSNSYSFLSFPLIEEDDVETKRPSLVI